MIPRRFIRVWLGPNVLDATFEGWWLEFQRIHPGWQFVTLRDADALRLVARTGDLARIYADCENYAARSDVVRFAALLNLGGVYVDTDVMPLRSFEPLMDDPRPFAGKRSGKSFEAAVVASPPGHPAAVALVERMPAWYDANAGRAASVRTGPGYLSSVWFGREDVRHLPTKTFYPFDGFMPPSRPERVRMFNARDFPPEMLAAHFSNHRWGGRPK